MFIPTYHTELKPQHVFHSPSDDIQEEDETLYLLSEDGPMLIEKSENV